MNKCICVILIKLLKILHIFQTIALFLFPHCILISYFLRFYSSYMLFPPTSLNILASLYPTVLLHYGHPYRAVNYAYLSTTTMNVVETKAIFLTPVLFCRNNYSRTVSTCSVLHNCIEKLKTMLAVS